MPVLSSKLYNQIPYHRRESAVNFPPQGRVFRLLFPP